ncbi:GGDEF domain-containing protein [Inhella proteolytica]|uniref:diguanylate cyclase n=1 Tax=Inhella proteolytica TaxID=2795029 RepID=A0A931J2N8_9BURK|nr:GGDEF domain-containing protein [Inhella proteolytica]MBH9577045.1 GGDEF domain-containing protein [Inhella proteolytica]
MPPSLLLLSTAVLAWMCAGTLARLLPKLCAEANLCLLAWITGHLAGGALLFGLALHTWTSAPIQLKPGLLLGLLTMTLPPALTFALVDRALRADTQRQVAQWQRDGLTGLLTRRALMERAGTLRRSADGSGIAVILLDLDHFKCINDRHLHSGGDRVLVHAARQLQAGLRLTDLVARIGGEEFCILLPGASSAQALELAERLTTEARAQRVRMADGSEQRYTFSAGCAESAAMPDDDAAWAGLLERADRALYAAKRSGRDRVVPWSTELACTQASAGEHSSSLPTPNSAPPHATGSALPSVFA